MKELWSILMAKLKEVEPTVAAVIIGICGLFTIGMITVVTVEFFQAVAKIVELTTKSGSAHF